MLEACEYLTMEGWRPARLKETIMQYSEKYHKVIGLGGIEYVLKDWKVRFRG